MRQQINLYQPIFSQERKQFSARTVAAGLGVIVVMLGSVSAFAGWRVSQVEKAVVTLREQRAQQEAMIQQASELNAARGSVSEITARVEQLEETVNSRRTALQVLQAGAAGQTTGFASRVEALARRHIDGLWIDGLTLSGSTRSMTLQGATLNVDIVPAYLQGLAQEPVLNGIRFDEFVIERPGRRPQKVSTDESSGAANHIRFRAGSKSLAPAQPEATT